MWKTKQILFVFEVLVHRYNRQEIILPSDLYDFIFFLKALASICSYFAYKARYSNSSSEIPEFPIASEHALEILMAANFLDC